MASTSGALQFSEPALEQLSYPAYLVGFSPYDRTTSAMFRIGEDTIGQDGSVWSYGKATAAIALTPPAPPASGFPMASPTPITPVNCAINPAGDIAAGATHRAYASFAVGEYGWVKRAADLI